MNQSINTDSKNSKEPQQKYRLGTVSIKILGGLNRFYRRLTLPSASIMAQNIQLLKHIDRDRANNQACSLPDNIWVISHSFITVNKLSELFREIRFPTSFLIL